MELKPRHFISAFLAGLTGGLITGALFAPKSGKELREDIKEKAKTLSADMSERYTDAHKLLAKKVNALKKAGEKINKEQYTKLVNDVITELKENSKVSKETATKLGKLLREDFESLVKTVTKPAKTTSTKTK
jgi:gas vesicle protein